MTRAIKATAESLKLLTLKPLITAHTASKHTASIIFLHGSGDTGDGIKAWLNMALGTEFTFPHIRIIYPTAPVRPYTPMNGMPSTVWFDRQQISPFCPEDLKNIDEMCGCLDDIVAREAHEHNISTDRIIVGGFSMGGSLALHYGYRFCTDLAGVFALSCFLNDNSAVYDAVRNREGEIPPLFQAHGARDPLVDPRWGGGTHKNLKLLGVNGLYRVYPNLFHEINQKEIEALQNWIVKRLPVEEAPSGLD